MEANKIFIQDLIDGIIDRYIPFTDSLSSLLSTDPIRGTKSIVRIIDRTLKEFKEYLPLKRTQIISISSGPYRFIDNYSEWVNDNSVNNSIDALQLIPTSIVSLGVGTYKYTANYWRYEKPILYMTEGVYTITTFNEYPFYLEYNSQGLPKKDSHIFGIDTKDENQFYNLLDLNMLRAIKRRTDMIKLPINIDFLNLDDAINELADQVEMDRTAAASLMIAWI